MEHPAIQCEASTRRQEHRLGQAPGETAPQRPRQSRQVRPGYMRTTDTCESAAMSTLPKCRKMNKPYVHLQEDTRKHICATENYIMK